MTENNTAVVGTIGNLTPIEGADKIVSASVVLNGISIADVIVSVDTEPGVPVVYFDSNLCLSKEFLEHYPDMGRYLGKNGRVKAIKLKGVYSDGLTVELSKFFRYFDDEKTAATWLAHGKAFQEIEGFSICSKYVPPVRHAKKGNKERRGNTKNLSRLIEGQFHFHVDTSSLALNIHKLNPDDVISISRKVHGTSSIAGRVLVRKKMSLIDKIAAFFGADVQKTEYDVLYSSRRVVKNDAVHTGYYSENIWTEAGKLFADKLKDGETAYFEIIGFTPNGSWIQRDYDYGYKQGTYGIRLYRMTKTSPDGDVTEYSWPLLKEKALQLGIPMVQEYYYGTAKSLFPEIPVDSHWHESFLERLRQTYLEWNVQENLCKKVPDEGIVLRIESANIHVYKLKSKAFLKKETDLYEKASENMEDDESANTDEV